MVLVLRGEQLGETNCIAQVYEPKGAENSWRMINTPLPKELYARSSTVQSHHCLKGSLFWLIEVAEYKLLQFDVGREVFCVIDFPPPMRTLDVEMTFLVTGESLQFFAYPFDFEDEDQSLKFCSSEFDGIHGHSWSTCQRVDFFPGFRFLKLTYNSGATDDRRSLHMLSFDRDANQLCAVGLPVKNRKLMDSAVPFVTNVFHF